jgi:hypothetical protein
MLIAGGELEVGEVVSFEFVGPDCRPAGLAEVAHRTDEAKGLRFTRWDASADRDRRPDRRRSCQQHMQSAARSVHASPGFCTGTSPE